MEEFWVKVNKFLKEDFRKFLLKKVIDNLVAYTIYCLIIISSLVAVVKLSSKGIDVLLSEKGDDMFPVVLEFAEYIFLYFLPIFILFGILYFYKLEWKRQMGDGNKPDPNAQEKLNLSKKLFFSSVLSYVTLKIVEILFFKHKDFDFSSPHVISIGVFFFGVMLFIVLSNKRH